MNKNFLEVLDDFKSISEIEATKIRNELLKEYEFEPVSIEHKNKVLKRLIRRIG